MEKIIESIVPDGEEGKRLDRYLAERFTYFSRTRWQKEIEAGRLSLNGRVTRNSHGIVRKGDRLRYRGSEREEPPVDMTFSFLYEDDFFCAVSKSGNIPVHPAGRYFNNTLLMHLETVREEKLFPLHRLDRETSGVVLFSRRKNATAAFQKALHDGWKTYLAIVEGCPPRDSFIIDTPLGEARHSPVRKKREAFPGAPEGAETHFHLLKNFFFFSLLEARLVTGRLHQIRAHLESCGLPIIGDKMYGRDERAYLDFIEGQLTVEEAERRLYFPRTALHARRVHLSHPFTGDDLTITAPLPRDMTEFFSRHGIDGVEL